MVALIIIGIIVLVIALIMLIPVGADIAYENSELKVSAKFCGMLLQLYPRPPEEKKEPKKPEKEKKPEEEKPKEKKPVKLPKFNKEELMELAKAGISAAGRFGRKIKVDRFLLHYTAAGRDPYNTAMTYAYVNAALSVLAPMCAQHFTVKKSSVRTDVDFTKEKMELDLGIAMTVRIGQMATIGIGTGIKALKILKRNKRRLRAEESETTSDTASASTEAAAYTAAAEAAPAAAEDINNTDKEENIQAEERNDQNG